jgi:hypothetical protein
MELVVAPDQGTDRGGRPAVVPERILAALKRFART